MKPNILLIMVDQQRYDTLGVYGHPDVRSPHIDGLAADGVRFTHVFCPFPICTPSRYSIFSGVYVHEHGGWSNSCTPRPGTPMFPAMLRRAGYRTAAVGKMHFTPTYLDVGFDEMVLAEQDGPGRWDDDYHRYLRDRGLVDWNDLEDQRAEYRDQARPEYWKTFGALVSNLPEEHHSTTWIGDRAAERLEAWGSSGNFLTVSFVKPHHPFDPPAPWHEMYRPETLALPGGYTPECLERDLAFGPGYFDWREMDEAAMRRALAYGYACISHVDAQVGRLLDLLRAKGLYDDTLILYLSDHGDYGGLHHMLLKVNYMYDPVMRVPLIVKLPGNARRGGVREELVSLVDVAPTVLAQAGVPRDPAMSGYDLAGRVERDVVFGEDLTRKQLMARTKRFKLIETEPGKESLFLDLERDPWELRNLIDEPRWAGEVDALRRAIRAWRGENVDTTPYLDLSAPRVRGANVPDDDPARREEMAAYFWQASAPFRRGSATADR